MHCLIVTFERYIKKEVKIRVRYKYKIDKMMKRSIRDLVYLTSIYLSPDKIANTACKNKSDYENLNICRQLFAFAFRRERDSI